ncbi:MAG: HEPN domain-containing protein [Mucilaginibacter polytrichastri]|nr:HEPN domain-containing protein [Mucilaginibacter polytrichastri]
MLITNIQGEYTQFLSPSEINNPKVFIRDFFSADFPKRHFKRLGEWRYFVINDESFSHPHGGPGALLFTYDLNVKLLEAAYLLTQKHHSTNGTSNAIPKLPGNHERHQWLYYPKHLKRKETSEPYNVLTKIFTEFSLFEYRSFLHDWLTAAFDKRSARESLDAREIIMVYENLQKLYDATWLIHQRETDATLYKFPKLKTCEKFTAQNPVVDSMLKSDPTAGEKLALNALVQLIRKNWPNVRAIIHLGTNRLNELFHLMVLVDDDSKVLHGELASTIEKQLLKFAETHVLIHKVSVHQAGVKQRARFWVYAKQHGTILFGEGLLKCTFVSPANLTNEERIERALFHWNRWGRQGSAFLKGAKYYYARGHPELAAFMLHQSMESTLKGIIQAATGYRIMIHNLSRILKISRLFTDDLFHLFDKAEGQLVLRLIQSAYTEARYKNNYTIESDKLQKSIEYVELVCEIAEALFQKRINSLKLESGDTASIPSPS